MEEDFGDLVAEGDLAEMPAPAQKDRTAASDLSSMPTDREVKLALEVQELRRQVEIKDAQIALLHATGQQAGDSAGDTKLDEPFDIPPQLTATLSMLREHVAELTRDNDALRNTFLPRHRVAGKMVIVPDPGKLQEGVTEEENASGSRRTAAVDSEEVDLEVVVQYVKDLMRENEELGAMVMEAGKTDQTEWQAALDESRAVIDSLDADLEHHLQVIQRLQAELAESQAIADQRKPRDESKAANTDWKGQGRTREGDYRHRGSRHGEPKSQPEIAGGPRSQPYSTRDARQPKDRQNSGQSMSILGAAISSGRSITNVESHTAIGPSNARGSDRNDQFLNQHGHRRAGSRDARDTRPLSAPRGPSDRDSKRRR